MTDTERALTGLQNLRDAILHDYIRETDQAVRTIDDAIELLKEQEPKPVELHTNAYGTKFYFCPKCKRELFHTRNLNFCERCGQAVKWDDDD